MAEQKDTKDLVLELTIKRQNLLRERTEFIRKKREFHKKAYNCTKEMNEIDEKVESILVNGNMLEDNNVEQDSEEEETEE